MRKKEKFISAYMTLELSLLFPMILTVLICVIYLFFFSYNQTVAFQNAAISALYGKEFAYTDTVTQKMYDVLERLNRNQYLSIKSLRQAVEIKNNDIKVSQTGDMVMPLLHGEIISKFHFEEKVVLDLRDSVFYIRQIRKVKKNGN